MNDLISRAREFATERHGGQLRKYDGTPYTMHLYRVSELVSMIPNISKLAIAASWLHDTREDTNTSEDEIWLHFGLTVATIVDLLTDMQTPEVGNRALRKANYALRLSNIRCESFARITHSIKTADLIDNGKSIMRHDPKFAKVYFAEIRNMIHGGYLRYAYSALFSALVGLANRYYRESR